MYLPNADFFPAPVSGTVTRAYAHVETAESRRRGSPLRVLVLAIGAVVLAMSAAGSVSEAFWQASDHVYAEQAIRALF